MSITLDKLVFDPANPADGGSVGSYLRSSDGTLLTHTDVGGKKALDVSIADGVNVEVDLSHLDDSVALGNGTDLFTSTSENGDISLDVHVSNSDLDIRDLVFATDSVDVSGSEVSLDAATLAALESITVSATDLDIRDLTHVSDSVKVGDGVDFLAINADGSINTTPASASAAAYGQKTITSTATKIIATALANRRSVIVQNLGSKDVYFGHDASITDVNTVKVSAGSSIELPLGATLDVYAITSSSTSDIRFLEVA